MYDDVFNEYSETVIILLTTFDNILDQHKLSDFLEEIL